MARGRLPPWEPRPSGHSAGSRPPLALLAGLGGRVAGLGIAGLMVGAASTHLPNGFLMNWFGALPPGAEGFEYHLLALAMALSLAIGGSGAWSLDRVIVGRDQ